MQRRVFASQFEKDKTNKTNDITAEHRWYFGNGKLLVSKTGVSPSHYLIPTLVYTNKGGGFATVESKQCNMLVAESLDNMTLVPFKANSGWSVSQMSQNLYNQFYKLNDSPNICLFGQDLDHILWFSTFYENKFLNGKMVYLSAVHVNGTLTNRRVAFVVKFESANHIAGYGTVFMNVLLYDTGKTVAFDTVRVYIYFGGGKKQLDEATASSHSPWSGAGADLDLWMV